MNIHLVCRCIVYRGRVTTRVQCIGPIFSYMFTPATCTFICSPCGPAAVWSPRGHRTTLPQLCADWDALPLVSRVLCARGPDGPCALPLLLAAGCFSDARDERPSRLRRPPIVSPTGEPSRGRFRVAISSWAEVATSSDELWGIQVCEVSLDDTWLLSFPLLPSLPSLFLCRVSVPVSLSSRFRRTLGV